MKKKLQIDSNYILAKVLQFIFIFLIILGFTKSIELGAYFLFANLPIIMILQI